MHRLESVGRITDIRYMWPDPVGQPVDDHDHRAFPALCIDVSSDQVVARTSNPGNIGLEGLFRTFLRPPASLFLGKLVQREQRYFTSPGQALEMPVAPISNRPRDDQKHADQGNPGPLELGDWFGKHWQ